MSSGEAAIGIRRVNTWSASRYRHPRTGHFTFPLRPQLPPGHPGYGKPLPRNEAERHNRLDGLHRSIPGVPSPVRCRRPDGRARHRAEMPGPDRAPGRLARLPSAGVFATLAAPVSPPQPHPLLSPAARFAFPASFHPPPVLRLRLPNEMATEGVSRRPLSTLESASKGLPSPSDQTYLLSYINQNHQT